MALLALASVLFLAATQAAPPAHAKGGKNGGNDTGGVDTGGAGPTPELRLKWRVPLAASYSRVRPVIGPDGTVYVVDSAGTLTAVDPDPTLPDADRVKWSAIDAGSKGVDVAPDGTIYTGNEDSIKAFNPDGSPKWTFEQNPRAYILQDVAVGPDPSNPDNWKIYAVATSGMGVFALADRGDHAEERWRTPEVYARSFVAYTELEFGPTSSPQTAYDGQLYFYANGFARAVRLSDGTPIFALGTGNTQPRVSLFDGSWHWGDSAYTPDGELIWRFEFPLATGFTEPSLAPGGTHYVANAGDVLYAIDPFGRMEWRAPLGEFVGSPDVDPTETLVIMEAGGDDTGPVALKAVSASNGSALWRMEFPPAEDADGNVLGIDQFIGSAIAYTGNGDTAYVMTALVPSTVSMTYLNAVDTNSAVAAASTVLSATAVTVDVRTRRKGTTVTGTVTVTDEARAPVSGATVSVTWELPDGSVQSQVGTTGGDGQARFSLSGGPAGLYTLNVDDLARAGYTFDPEHSLLSGAGS